MDYKILLISSFLLLAACERNAGSKAKLSIQFPQVTQSTSGKVTTLSTNGSTEEWSSITPTGFNTGNYPFNCYGVYISGPEPFLKANKCGQKDFTTPMREFGYWKGGVPAGGTVWFDVESGKDRVVGIFGFHVTDITACKDFTGAAQMNQSLFSKPYFLGETGRLEFLAGETKPVTVNLAFDSSQYFEECRGPGFQNGGTGGGTSPIFADFGTGLDGDLTVTSGLTDVRSTSSPGRSVPLITTTRVESLTTIGGDPYKLAVGTRATGMTTKFVAGDEVALYVAAASGATGCGPNIFSGFRTRGIVSTTASQTLNIQVDDNRFATIPGAALTASSYGGSRDFCRLLVTRVPNLNILTFQGSGGSMANLAFNAASFGELSNDSADHEAGLIFIRVKDKIILNSPGGIDVATRGFSAGNYGLGSNFLDGQGVWGATAMTASGAANGTGGSGYVTSSNGPGGGGHGGTGGNGYYAGVTVNGGGVVGDQYGCGSTNYDAQMKCLFGKMFMGGGGGSGSDAAGGNGGGLIYLAANIIQLNSFAFTLNADGAHSGSGSTMGGAGGAGGAILAMANAVTGSTNAALKIRSNGGISKSISGLGKGGSGGGGRNHLHVLGSCAIPPSSVIMESYSPTNNAYGSLSGADGTNFLSGLGIASCGSITTNQTPYITRLNPDNTIADTTSGVTFTVYGKSFAGMTSAALQNTTTLALEACTVGSVTDSSFTCTTTAPSAQYHLIVMGATGHKSVLNSAIFLSP